MIWTVIIIYLLALLAIAYWVNRRIRWAKDDVSTGYYLGGKSLGSGVLAMTYAFTGISASGTIGLVGLNYTIGWTGAWLFIAAGLGFALAFVVLGPRIWDITQRTGALTVIDLIHKRFQSNGLSAISAAMIVLFFIPYLMVQYIGAGILFETFLGIDYEYAVLLFGMVVAIYVSLGGFLAVAYSDTLQGILLVIGFIALTTVGLTGYGGLGAMNASFEEAIPGAVSSPWGVMSPMQIIGLSLPFVLGYAGMPMMTMRFMTARSKNTLRLGGAIAAVVPVLAAWFVVVAPSMAHHLLPEVERADAVLPMLIMEIFPPLVAAFFLTVLLSAMMSTADSILMISGSTITRDLFQRFIRPDITDRQLFKISQLVMLVVGVVGLALALLPELPLLQLMVAWVFGIFAATFTFLFLGVAWWKRMNLPAAYAALLGGTITYVGWSMLDEPFSIPALIFSLAVMIPVVVLATHLFPKQQPVV